MMFWKMIFLFNWVIFRFHVNLPGCSFQAKPHEKPMVGVDEKTSLSEGKYCCQLGLQHVCRDPFLRSFRPNFCVGKKFSLLVFLGGVSKTIPTFPLARSTWNPHKASHFFHTFFVFC